MSIFDGLPIPKDKSFLREELSKIDESWAAARFDSLPHVVQILTSKDREGDVKVLKEQSDIIEEVVDEVVHAYHGGFNKAIQNYSQILRLFSESAQSIAELKVDLAQAKKLLGAHNKQLHQLWYRSVTLRHIIALLDQIEGIAKVPARIEKLIAEKHFYAAVQLYVQSSIMLEREGLQAGEPLAAVYFLLSFLKQINPPNYFHILPQVLGVVNSLSKFEQAQKAHLLKTVGALQDVRSELTKLRGAFFYKVLEDLHSHLYNKGDYSDSSDLSSILESDDEIPTSTSTTSSMKYSHSLSRRTRLLKGDGDGVYLPSSVDGGSSLDGQNDGGNLHDEAVPNGTPTMKANGGDVRTFSRQIPVWLSDSTPDEFVEAMRKSDAPLHVKYLQTLVKCLSMLGKVAAAGAIICQRLRPTIHDIISTKIKAHAARANGTRSGLGHTSSPTVTGLHYLKGQQLANQKCQNGVSPSGALLAVSPVSHVMSPYGTAQVSARELLDSILDTVVRIFENHVIVGELLESKSLQQGNLKAQKAMASDFSRNNDSDASNTGGFTIGFSLNVLQSECQQLLCEILRATPDATSADAAVQTARLASKVPSKDKSNGSEDGLTFAFRFTDASASIQNQGELTRQGRKKGSNALQEGYGTGAVLPEQGIYLASSVYRPVVQFTDKIALMLPQKFSQLGNDGLLAFTENFVKDHFLPTMFVDYRKSVQQAISSPAAFRPRANASAVYTPSIQKGRPVLQGLLAIDCLAKEVLGWAQAMPKFAGELINYVQTFLERAYERCRTSYMEAVLEKQSYMLIGRYDVDNLLRLDPASTCLSSSLDERTLETNDLDGEANGAETELSDILLNLRPIKQENLIRDDNKLILLASLSDSLDYVADSVERLASSSSKAYNPVEENGLHHARTNSVAPKDLPSFAEEYRKLASDCLKVLRIEMQLETIFHLQEMTKREYMEDQDAEEPDDFVISLTSQITRRDEELTPFIADVKRSYIFGGICPVAANWSIKALAEIKSINLFGVQQICRNSIALEQALAAISSIDSEVVETRLDRVRTYYELLNMPFEALLAFIQEHEEYIFSAVEYGNLLKVFVPGREIPEDAQDRASEILLH